ncbi:hypothetical protein DFR72_111161 [Lentzea flaviverrucosa]|uniref:Uncharacterized protein n=1 Tax=Lentzea flaviverrucosa TaxID=200379 RepID=A0A1H9WRD4_9PSEU|nr:hypothetical protein DFR72_111161 [Lentzea flaviverrucosa]SES36445.1 hypothetical protein SAMN05216195_112155 [Lentzea flaviverrucosa]
MLPDANDCPACILQYRVGLLIPHLVAGDFVRPVGSVGPRDTVVLRAAMPETAIYEDRDSCLCEYDVSSTAYLSNGPSAYAEPQALRMQQGTDGLLWPGVPAPAAQHRPPDGVARRPALAGARQLINLHSRAGAATILGQLMWPLPVLSEGGCAVDGVTSAPPSALWSQTAGPMTFGCRRRGISKPGLVSFRHRLVQIHRVLSLRLTGVPLGQMGDFRGNIGWSRCH